MNIARIWIITTFTTQKILYAGNASTVFRSNHIQYQFWSLITRNFNLGSGNVFWFFKWCYWDSLYLKRNFFVSFWCRGWCCFCFQIQIFPNFICVVFVCVLHHAKSLNYYSMFVFHYMFVHTKLERRAERNTDIFESNNNFSVAQWRTKNLSLILHSKHSHRSFAVQY